MEAWLKFRVEGVTLNIGLSIGKKIFRVLNRMEWIFFVSYGILWVLQSGTSTELLLILSVVLLGILATQTFYLLPKLDKRINLIMAGENVMKSRHHIYFVALELLKVSLLIWLACCWWISVIPTA
jgi:hypothetical protein